MRRQNQPQKPYQPKFNWLLELIIGWFLIGVGLTALLYGITIYYGYIPTTDGFGYKIGKVGEPWKMAVVLISIGIVFTVIGSIILIREKFRDYSKY